MSEHSNRANQKPPSVDRLSQLWHRVNDHKMVQWSVAYVALAYGIQHAVVLTSEAFDWPHEAQHSTMLLLVLGVPVAITFAWYQGARASRNFSQAELSILTALLVVGSLLFYLFVRTSDISVTPALQQAGVGAARTAVTSPKGAISLAVLPFVNLSGDATQEFFSDGMTEEITSALAKVPNLRVVGRTSAFQFKSANKDLRAIGQALSATHLIEGSVRKDGNQLRITAQLIKADDGTHVWTESYDRELKGVFAVQEEIAQAIAASLRVPLGLKLGENLVSSRNIDPELYQEYLRARTIVRGSAAYPEAIAGLEKIVAADPGYAPAWALLAYTYTLQVTQTPTLRRGSLEEARRYSQSYLDKAEPAARKAIQLDPHYADGYVALGRVQALRANRTAADDLFKQALAIDPNDAEVLDIYSNRLGGIGHLKQALELRERLQTLEPFVPLYNAETAIILQNIGRNEDSISILKTLPAANVGAGIGLARAYAALGRYDEAADALLAIRTNLLSRQSIEDAARLLRTAPAKVKSPEALPVFEGDLLFVYAHIGAPERAMEYLDRLVALQLAVAPLMWSPELVPIRKTERFKAYLRASGLVEYWRARGWPDMCHPTTGADFVCD